MRRPQQFLADAIGEQGNKADAWKPSINWHASMSEDAPFSTTTAAVSGLDKIMAEGTRFWPGRCTISLMAMPTLANTKIAPVASY